MCKIVTPLKLQAWEEALSDYPEKAFSVYILREIKMGFKISFDSGLVGLLSRKGNLSSALNQPDIVEKYLQEELLANRLIKVQPLDDPKSLNPRDAMQPIQGNP